MPGQALINMETKFLIFGYYDYEASGGWNDHLETKDSLEEAITVAIDFKFYDTVEIVEFPKGEVVWRNRG